MYFYRSQLNDTYETNSNSYIIDNVILIGIHPDKHTNSC